MSIERIVDLIDKNNFGVLLHDVQTIEDFQRKSGMEGRYTTEYQHHYINLIGRIATEGQRLDIAIPMIMYNYHQEVSGAAVEFNMGEVGEANNEAMKLALEKFNEFETTDFYKELCALGITTWELHGLNSIHAHPTGVNRFSGTDLRADIKHPGVNFPLNEGTDAPNFASIIQHKNEFAEIIHTEYRLFNGKAGGERVYKKGRTLTIVRGVVPPDLTAETELANGPIDAIFGTTRPQPPKKIYKARPSYFLRDGFSPEEGKDIAKELMTLWEDCEFQIDTSLVLKTNVLRGRGRLQRQTDSWGHSAPGKMHQRTLMEINAEIFGEDVEEKERPASLKFGENDFETPERYVMLQFLMFKGWTRSGTLKLTPSELENEFWNERLDELEEAEEDTDIDIDDMKEYLKEKKYADVYLNTCTKQKIKELYAKEVDKEFEEGPDDEQLINMLVADNITSREKLKMMAPKDLHEMFNEVYGIMP